MNPIWSAVIAAVVGLISGIIGSLFAPWVNWGIEKQRDKLKQRREVVQRCREKLDNADFNKRTFRVTLEYRYLKPFLIPAHVEGIERDLSIIVGQVGDDPGNPYRQILAEAVDKLERQWDLI